MAKASKVLKSQARHSVKAPCQQMFNVSAKPGVKRKSWWNGYRTTSRTAEAS